MASAPCRLATGAVVLLALWVVTYWLTPAPSGTGVRISFAEGPSPEARSAGGEAEPVPIEEVDPVRVPREAPEPLVIPPTFRVYTTEPGDTLQRVAARFYGSPASWRVIARANPTVDPNRLGPGVRLHIPVDPSNIQGRPADAPEGAAQPAGAESEFTEYVVQVGDTLSEIAKALYGRATLWRLIADANPEIDPDRLRPGTTLRIPPPAARD